MILSLLGVAFLGVASAQGTERVQVPDLQDQIRRLVDAQSETEWHSALEALRADAGEEHQDLVRQLFHFLRESTSTREAMAFGVIREALSIPDAHVLNALVPLLDTDDEAQRAALRGVLSEFEKHSPGGEPDFSIYEGFLAAAEPTPGLERYLMEINPAVAVGTLARARERDREVLPTGPGFRPVTDAMLRDPDPADWLNWRRTLDGQGYSPLDQIDRGNVGELQLVWGWALPDGLVQAAPLVHDGIMFVPSPRVVQAVDAVTGDRLWEYRRDFEASEALEAVGAGMRTRSIAIYGDKIYVNTSDAHIVALDARTGEVAWDHTVADFRLGYRYTSGPIVVNGLIVAGMTGCQNYKNDVCFISAHDPDTGGQVWRTSTIARPGEPGGDTWGDLPLTFRAGADSWIPGAYDPETNLTYWSTSQAKPWARVSRKTDGDALYTNSVLALDPATGELQWYFQFVPGETHDLDDVFESVLIDHRGRKSLFKMGKHGILWELDRETGAFTAAHDLGYQNVLDVDPATGEVTYRPEMIPVAGVELDFCPDFGGVRNWRASAYHPGTQLLYIPIHPTCVRGMFTELEQVEGNDYYADRGWFSRGSRVHPDSGEHAGHLIAMDIDTGEIRWRHSTATRPGSAALTTAGGLVVSSDTDRNLFVHDVENGDVLFHTRLPGSVQGFPITYAVDGRQYLAAPVGGGRTNAVYVFALP